MTEDDWVEIDGVAMYWPRCVIGGCPNRICLAKGETRYCWPHSSSGKSVAEIIDEAETTKESVE